MRIERPRFLDEDVPPDGHGAAPPPRASAPADHLIAPVLLDAEPDAPAEVNTQWQPPDLAVLGAATTERPWVALGVAVIIVSLALFSLTGIVLSLMAQAFYLGLAAGLALAIGLGLIGCGMARSWRNYRQLQLVERKRAELMDPSISLEQLRAAASDWLSLVATSLPDADTVHTAVRMAPSAVEIRAVLRDRAADPLRDQARAIGQRAALQAATLVAISPHASWDGLIAGWRGLMLIRDVARLFGLRPGWAVTLLLMRKVAWTAAGISGVDLLAQSLADHTLGALPVVKHVASAVPGSGVAAIRLYRIANLTAEACCPVS